MAFKGVLKIGGEERTLLTYHNYLFDMWYGDFVHVPEYFPTLYDYAAAAQASPYAFRRQAGTQPFGGLFDFTMESTDDDDFFYDWFKISERFGTRLEHGVIELYDAKDRYMPMRRIEFWDAWISEIAEYLRADSATPMTLHFTISPATIRVNKEVVFQKNWFVTDISQKEGQRQEKAEPAIKHIFWKGSQSDIERTDIMLNHTIELVVEFSKYEQGDNVELTVKQSNSRRIKGRAKEFTINGAIDEDGRMIIPDFKIECDFKEDNQDFGDIEFYYKDNKVGDLKENFGWTYIKEGGITKIFVNIKPEINYFALGCTEQDYKNAIQEQFKRTLELSSNGLFTGKIFFSSPHTTIQMPQATISLKVTKEQSVELKEGEAAITGGTTHNQAQSDSQIIDDGLLLMNLGETSVHELIHTLRLFHPHNVTQSGDMALIKDVAPLYYKTTSTTDANIYYNIMEYGFVYINGKLLSDLWKYKRPEYLTKGQLIFMLEEIDRQQNGEGSNKPNSNYSVYWADFPGEDVK